MDFGETWYGGKFWLTLKPLNKHLPLFSFFLFFCKIITSIFQISVKLQVNEVTTQIQ